MPRAAGAFPAASGFAVADFTGDGRPDVLATQGQPHARALYPPVVFVNDGHGGFIDQTSSVFSVVRR